MAHLKTKMIGLMFSLENKNKSGNPCVDKRNRRTKKSVNRTRETDIRRTSNIQYPVCVPLQGVTFEKQQGRNTDGGYL